MSALGDALACASDGELCLDANGLALYSPWQRHTDVRSGGRSDPDLSQVNNQQGEELKPGRDVGMPVFVFFFSFRAPLSLRSFLHGVPLVH